MAIKSNAPLYMYMENFLHYFAFDCGCSFLFRRKFSSYFLCHLYLCVWCECTIRKKNHRVRMVWNGMEMVSILLVVDDDAIL